MAVDKAMTIDFVHEVLDSKDVIYFPFCDWLFPNGIKINKVIFTIPWFNETSIDVYWYGFLIALGMLLAVVYASRRMRKFGLDTDRAIDVVLAGLVGAIIGARAYYVIFKLNELYLTDEGGLDIIKILSIRDGGLAIYGGVIGALVFGAVVAMIRKVRIRPMLDLMGLGLLIGQCLGRWGNFFNQEAYGSQTTLPWGMTSNIIMNGLYFLEYPEHNTVIANRARELAAHPCFLYESLWCLAGFLILHFYSKKFRKFDGEIFLMYIGWYGAGRFWIEALRTDSLFIPGTSLKVSQLVAGTCVLFAIALLVINYISIRKNGYVFYYETEESKELLRLRDEKLQQSRNRKGKDADAETDVHILADDVDDEGTEETEEDTEDSADVGDEAEKTSSADSEDTTDNEEEEHSDGKAD